MKKILLLLFLFPAFALQAQEDAWVYFNAKPDSEFYLANPLEMLSQRALDRRNNQGIALDVKDVPIHAAYIDAVANAGDIQVMARSKWLNALHIRGSVEAIQSLTALDFVESVDFADNSLDFSGRFAAPKKTKAVNKNMDAQTTFAYGNSANQIQMLNGHLLHQQNYTGAGKIIAVLDAGFPGVDMVQPFKRLRDNNKILGGYNFVDRDADFYTRNFHGTMVLSTMGGYTENQLVGTAPDAEYYLFITENADDENPVEESLWVEAAETADSLGVDVINTSLGYFLYDNPAYSHTYEEMDGVTSFISKGANMAFSRGMVVVVSAGNSGQTENVNVGSPGDAVDVLTVGAVDAFENYAPFSSIGPTFDGRVKPDVMAKGAAATVANPSGNIMTANGTSFSGPIIAGMVATFWSAAPWMTNAQVVQFIKESAHLFTTPTDDMGYGIPDFQAALDIAALSVRENAGSHFVLYPNPVQNTLFVSLGDSNEAQLTLYNTLGQLVSSQAITQNQPINLDTLGSGMYFYKIASANVTQSGKIIKR